MRSVVVVPSARETFTPRELAGAYKIFKEHGLQYLSAETGLRASAYRSGEHLLGFGLEDEHHLLLPEQVPPVTSLPSPPSGHERLDRGEDGLAHDPRESTDRHTRRGLRF